MRNSTFLKIINCEIIRVTERIMKKMEYYQDNYLSFCYLDKKNVNYGKRLTVRGIPFIYKHENAQIIIGNDVSLTSRNKENHHLNIFAPVKIIADRPGAIIRIGNNTRMAGTLIHAFKNISIGNNCLIATNTQIMDCNGHSNLFSNPENRIDPKEIGEIKEVVIEDCVWIGTNSIITPGVTIGYGSIVSAGAVVQKSFPSHSLIAGNPARLVSRNL